MASNKAPSWWVFEIMVARLYRRRGAVVHQRANVAGIQIDLLLEERDSASRSKRTAVECKYSYSSIPATVVSRFAITVAFLRTAGLIDQAVLVSSNGFTPEARLVAASRDIDLLTLEQLWAQAEASLHQPGDHEIDLAALREAAEQLDPPETFNDLVFVVMPFAAAFDDIYLYGIRSCVAKLGLACRRADEIEHVGEILKQTIDHLRRARIVVADLTGHNPNVFYELGWSHAFEKPTVLVAHHGTTLPFDVSHINTIFYTGIRHLEERLCHRIKSILA